MTEIEEKIFCHAVEKLKMNIDFKVETEILKNEIMNDQIKNDKIIKIKVQQMELVFFIEIINTINQAVISILLEQKKYLQNKQMIVTKYITPQMADELKKRGLQFIDAAGNAYINNFPLYIFLKGNKLPEDLKQVNFKRVFYPAGLKMVYALLKDPKLVNTTYRNIAKVAYIALGTVGWVMNDLKDMGFLYEIGKRKKELTKKNELLNRWCIEYAEKLKPKLILGRFQGAPDWWKDCKLNPKDAQWGGEVAANKLTKYLNPQNVTVYVVRNKYNNIIIENKLRKDEKGEVEFIQKFWVGYNDEEKNDTVDPILIYADLIATGEDRNKETAKEIYEKFIVRHFGKD